MSVVDDVIAAIEGKDIDEFPSGNHAIFVKLSDKWGAKLYRNHSARDSAFNLQRAAAEHGLGPQVGELFVLPHIHGVPRIGYTTEVIEPLFDDSSGDPNKSFRSGWAERKRRQIEYNKLITELYAKLGWPFVDSFIQNLGIMRGKLVPLDFGNHLPQYNYEPRILQTS